MDASADLSGAINGQAKGRSAEGPLDGGHDANEARLAAYYNQRARTMRPFPITSQRVAHREAFIHLLKAEARRSVLEIGCGVGIEGLEFVRAGIHYTGVDLSEESVHQARARRLEASVASGRSLPFAPATFHSLWTMSTLLHVPNSAIDEVLAEMVRVAQPGAPIAVGLWSGEDEEVLNPEDVIDPPRFFSRRSDATVLRIFGAHGSVESFETWPEGAGRDSGPGAGAWEQHYQYLILRTPS
ncbi:class I SAM-dependent methyltransferase [Arthrobacter sp. M4]|uniref:class I SAM-dependent methyltransferase n=1 Tax=Arthrobacter sp. M4 TaxID=218160 RepID=UPI001CDD6A12|nr:class I SAM-dependent methyltransferase [Arthrobacter sp. M4]MCA4133496.1 methyltransferase domain-containing protein [Arthrobacter sp. M4]